MINHIKRNSRILIVGTHSPESEHLIMNLRDLGLDCAVANTAKEAGMFLEVAGKANILPSIMICDETLPDSTGAAFVEIIRSDYRYESIPLIVATSQSTVPLRQQNFYEHAKSAGLIESVSGLLALHAGLRSDQDRTDATPIPAGEPNGVEILIAEDNDINQLVLAQFLETTPWTFHLVGNGRRAVHAFRKLSPRLILMDISMPEMNGREATSAIRALESGTGNHVPVIALTAHALKGDREACIAAGMDEYMAKPLNFDALRALIEHYLGNATDRLSAA